MKKVLILTGSANRNDTSLLLADKFEEGVMNAGNIVKRYNTEFLNIKGCIGCNYCKHNNGTCIQNDDFIIIKENLIKSDIVVFVTPLYYFDMSAQLKLVIDRLHTISSELSKKKIGTFLISTQASPLENTADVLKLHYKTITDYLKWSDLGMLIAKGVPSRKIIEKTDYPEMARKLRENI